jgi:cytoskeletal protein CcmA (bactofilin family)
VLSGGAKVFLSATVADLYINDGATSLTTTGVGTFASLDISGDVDVDGTLEADAITVNGTALATVIAGTTVTNATNSAHVLVTDNESTNEENLIAFVEGATSSTGNVGLEMDGNFTYNPSTGTVSATVFKGNIDAVDGDFDGTLEADAITIGGTAVGSIFSPIAGGTGIVTTGALDAGSITSGFGAINNGASNITTTGVGAFASLDISGDIDVDGTTNLDAVDIDGAVQLDATLTVGANDQGYDVILYGDTASANVTWDTSADDLIFNGAAGLVVPKDKITIGSTAVTTTAAELNKLDGAGTLKQAGLETIWVPATAMYPATTNGSSDLTQVETTALRPDLMVLDFAAAADDFAQFSIGFPKSWNEGTVTFQVFWTPSNTNTDDCIWSLQGVSVADGATIDVAYGTAVSVTDAGIGTVEDQQVSPVSGAVTITNAAVDTQTYFQIFRDGNAAGDDFSGVARLLGVKIFFTTDAANDA